MIPAPQFPSLLSSQAVCLMTNLGVLVLQFPSLLSSQAVCLMTNLGVLVLLRAVLRPLVNINKLCTGLHSQHQKQLQMSDRGSATCTL
jgi:hypothetical protein